MRIQRLEVGGSTWEVVSPPRPDDLRPFVNSWAGFVERSSAPVVRREIPTPSVVWVIELGAPIVVGPEGGPSDAHEGGLVAGLTTRATATRHEGSYACMQIDLAPATAARVLGVAMGTMAGRIESVADVLGLPGVELVERLIEARSWESRFAIVAEHIRRRLAGASDESPVIAWAVAEIERTGGMLRIDRLARATGYSGEHLARRLRAQIGLSPKQYARLVRFDRLAARARSAPAVSWAALAAELGYSDHAHLARDVRELSDLAPTQMRSLVLSAPRPAWES